MKLIQKKKEKRDPYEWFLKDYFFMNENIVEASLLILACYFVKK